jgi:hypothetical protein
VRISDFPNDVARRIVETNYDHEQSQVQCTLENASDAVDAWLERIGAALTGVV